jgi:rubredoxin
MLPAPPTTLRLEEARMKKRYRCMVCEHIYDPAEGDPNSGIPPGTAFEDLPGDWVCPDCGATKADFEPLDD